MAHSCSLRKKWVKPGDIPAPGLSSLCDTIPYICDSFASLGPHPIWADKKWLPTKKLHLPLVSSHLGVTNEPSREHSTQIKCTTFTATFSEGYSGSSGMLPRTGLPKQRNTSDSLDSQGNTLNPRRSSKQKLSKGQLINEGKNLILSFMSLKLRLQLRLAIWGQWASCTIGSRPVTQASILSYLFFGGYRMMKAEHTVSMKNGVSKPCDPWV